MTTLAARVRAAVESDDRAAARLLAFAGSRGIAHHGRVVGDVFARVAGAHPRSWRKWLAGERPSPLAEMRVICLAADIEVEGVWP